MARLLPLFPLQLVAFPGSAIPLHIFEDRYREMVGEAEAAGTEFGIVLSREGGVVNAGCSVVVESVVERYPDGRFDVITRGRRRFEIRALDHEKAYLRGDVEFFDDDDRTPPAADLRDAAIRAYSESEVDASAPFLSFQLAQSLPDVNFQSLLLRSRSESERLRQLIELARVKQVAPRNGFGHRPAVL